MAEGTISPNKRGSYIELDENGEHSKLIFSNMMQVGHFPPDNYDAHSVVRYTGKSIKPKHKDSATLHIALVGKITL